MGSVCGGGLVLLHESLVVVFGRGLFPCLRRIAVGVAGPPRLFHPDI